MKHPPWTVSGCSEGMESDGTRGASQWQVGLSIVREVPPQNGVAHTGQDADTWSIYSRGALGIYMPYVDTFFTHKGGND